MDNYYVDKPVFMVDLGSKTEINGVVVITWQGQGQGVYNDHLFVVCCIKLKLNIKHLTVTSIWNKDKHFTYVKKMEFCVILSLEFVLIREQHERFYPTQFWVYLAPVLFLILTIPSYVKYLELYWIFMLHVDKIIFPKWVYKMKL